MASSAIVTNIAPQTVQLDKGAVADSMLFSSALVLARAIAPFLTVSFPPLSDAHWAWASDFGL